MTETPPALTVENVTVDYDRHRAIDDLSLEINTGEIIGIIGPNGAGKTSFIKALCGHIKLDSGRFAFNGTIIKPRASRQSKIGLVPQDIGLYSHMTARENLLIFAKIMGIKGRRARAEAAAKSLAAVEMDHKSEALISELSGGMKRRINIAAAIMHSPPILILDEPTAGVDIPARDTVHRLARTISDNGTAVLLITHELEQAEALCDKLLILANGKKLAFDTPTAVLSKAYGNAREIMARFSTPPQGETLEALRPYKFTQAELPTVWTAMTNASQVADVSAFMASLRGGSALLREISVRRPGLTHLMHYIEKHGQLPHFESKAA